MPLLTLGINHKTAPVSVRERVAFSPETIVKALQSLNKHCDTSEVAILSTCNRTELYVHIEETAHTQLIVKWLAEYHKLSLDELQSYIYQHNEKDTVRHVLKVASGIDSMILGEPQILGQIKDAYRYAVQAGTAGTLLSRLFQYTFTVAKQVRTDTAIGSSPVSVAFSAVNLAKQIFGDLQNYTVLLIGAGETIELAARHMNDQGLGRMIVANRTVERAHDLASQFGGYAIALSEIPVHLVEADIVISSTASQKTIVSFEQVKQALKQRKHRPVFMVDLAVPRDIDSKVSSLDDIYLYTVDDLHKVVEENMQSRREAAKQAEEIIEVQVGHFIGWKRSLEAVDTICALRLQAESERDQVLNKAQQMLDKGKTPEDALQFLAHTLTNKLIHSPSATLKQAGSQGRSELIKAAKELFDVTADKANNDTPNQQTPDEKSSSAMDTDTAK